jgi:hypothetical protein
MSVVLSPDHLTDAEKEVAIKLREAFAEHQAESRASCGALIVHGGRAPIPRGLHCTRSIPPRPPGA